jgi:hypothetical protein
MNTFDNFDNYVYMAERLGSSVREAGGGVDFAGFLRIRRELNHFLLNLSHSSGAEGTGQQIHFLFLALDNLENIDREIRVSFTDEGMLCLEKVQDRIRSLKVLILDYIKHLTSEN